MSIANRIEQIENHLKDDYQSIANLGADLTNVDKNIENIAELLDGVYDVLPKTEFQEGTDVTIEGGLKGKIDFDTDNGKKIVGYGDTEQTTTEGYNLLPYVNRTRTINDVTFTNNGDGTITVNGTASANATYPLNVDSVTNTRNISLSAGTYVVVDGIGDYTNYFTQVNDGTTYMNTGATGGSTGISPSKTFSETGLFSAMIYVRSGVQMNNVTFKPMIVVSTNVSKPFEQYTGGNPAPSPSYPFPIQCVTGEQSIVESGKNLTSIPNFNFETRGMTNVANNQVINSSGTPVGSWFNISPADNRISQVLKANTKYVFWRNQDLSLPLTARFYYADSTYLNVTISANTHYVTFTPTQDTVNYYLYVGSGATADVPLTISNLQIMIYKGETDSANWEKYITLTSYQLSLGDIELNAIGNYEDELLYDVDEDKVYKNEKIKKVIINSSYRTSGGTTGTNAYYIATSLNDGLNDNSNILAYSNMFKGISFDNRSGAPDSVMLQSGSVTLRTRNNTDIDWSDNTKRDAWLNANTPLVYYVLATPVEIPITDTTLINQVKALYNAHSNNGTTIITSNGNLSMIIKVRALKG